VRVNKYAVRLDNGDEVPLSATSEAAALSRVKKDIENGTYAKRVGRTAISVRLVQRGRRG
jgi:hypothetical protein